MTGTIKSNGPKNERGAPKQKKNGEKKELHRLINEGARLLAQRKGKEAAEVLEKAYYLAPDDADVLINLGGAYILQHKFADAIAILEEATRVAPDNPMVWTNLAAAYLGHLEHAGEEEQRAAIAAFKKALELDPKAPHVNYNLGLIYLQRGDLTEALAHFRRALDVNPADKDALHYVQKLRLRLAKEQAQEKGQSSESSGEDGGPAGAA